MRKLTPGMNTFRKIFPTVLLKSRKLEFVEKFLKSKFRFFDEMSNTEKRKSNATGSPGTEEKIKPIRSEREVGIILHLSKHEKFDAVVKNRYSDFHVNEIDPNGKIVHLTSYELPKDERENVDESDPIFNKFLMEEVRLRVQMLNSNKDERNAQKERIEIEVTETTKEERTKIHRWLNNYEKLSSETLDKDGRKLIVVAVQKKGRQHTRRPANRGKFTHCVLYKEGVETTDAIGYLARKLKMRPNHITFAGTKDKQSKSTQRICFSNTDAAHLLELNKYSSQSRLGNFEYQPKRLNLGDLSGNHFKILLKNVLSESDSIIHTAIENLRTHGFINYFGLQRFGSYAVPTHIVGKAMIQLQYEQVFDLILENKAHDPDFMTAAKKIWFSTRDAKEAIKLIPSWCRTIDANLLYGLSKYYERKDYQSSLACIPRTMRMLYVHAYQSYVWNRLASYRIREYGLVPVVGDLVYDDSEEDPVANEVQDEEVDDNDIMTMCDVSFENTRNPDLDREGRVRKVKVLTVDDLSKYTIYDIVIPMHGKDIVLPKNKVNDYFEQLLLEGGIEAEALQKFRSRPDAPKGAYRKLVVLPKDVSYKLIPYSDSEDLDSFIPSDLDLMEKSETIIPDLVSSEESAKNKLCIVLEFSLPTSSYATMALREVLRGEEPVTLPNVEEVVNQDQIVQQEPGNLEDDGIAKKPRLELVNNEFDMSSTAMESKV